MNPDRYGGAEIVGNGKFVAAEILSFRADPVVVENLQPILCALLSPGDGAGVRFVTAALVVWKELRVDQSVTEVAVELRIEPVHHLVDFGALFQVFRIGRQFIFVGEILRMAELPSGEDHHPQA